MPPFYEKISCIMTRVDKITSIAVKIRYEITVALLTVISEYENSHSLHTSYLSKKTLHSQLHYHVG